MLHFQLIRDVLRSIRYVVKNQLLIPRLIVIFHIYLVLFLQELVHIMVIPVLLLIGMLHLPLCLNLCELPFQPLNSVFVLLLVFDISIN